MNMAPDEIIQKISKIYSERYIYGLDVNKQVYVYIQNIDGIKKKKYLTDLTGRGLTYQDACIDYINKCLDRSICLRYKRSFYATTKIRTIINKTDFRKKYIEHAESND